MQFNMMMLSVQAFSCCLFFPKAQILFFLKHYSLRVKHIWMVALTHYKEAVMQAVLIFLQIMQFLFFLFHGVYFMYKTCQPCTMD